MDFVRYADSVRAKLHMGGVRLPVLVGITSVAIAVLVAAGVGAASIFSVDSAFTIESGQAGEEGGEASQTEQVSAPTCFVHVGGAVACPGLYELPDRSRVQQAVDAAGGFAEGAAVDSLNLARTVSDGEQIIVPFLESSAPSGSDPGSGQSASISSDIAAGTAAGGKININTATAETLQQLSGVGPSLSERIVADRQANGPFTSVEDLKRVSGIGDKKYAALADRICVG